MELTEDFIKLLTIAIGIVGVLAIFFIFIQYNILIGYSSAHRESLVLGDSLIINPCIVELDSSGYPIKGLLSKKLLDNYAEGCMKYNRGEIKIVLEDEPYEKIIKLGPNTGSSRTTYPIAIKMDLGDVKIGFLEVAI